MIEIKRFTYEPYRLDNGTLVENPTQSYFRSEEPRPANIDTIIAHSMYVKDELSGKKESYDVNDCKDHLESSGFSTHYFVDRNGQIWQMVDDEFMAWHAGTSKMPEPDGRAKVNQFSIGVELIANEVDGFTSEQYLAFAGLIAQLMSRYAIENILGHKDIAGPLVRPDSPKTDPWNLNWSRLMTLVEAMVDPNQIERLKLVAKE